MTEENPGMFDTVTEQMEDRIVVDAEELVAVPFTPDDILGQLAEARKRYVLYYLRERGGRDSFSDLVDHLTIWEHLMGSDRPLQDVRTSVKTHLQHSDLPSLADHGLVTFDVETGEVAATDRLYRITPYLDFLCNAEPEQYESFCDLLREEDPETGDWPE